MRIPSQAPSAVRRTTRELFDLAELAYQDLQGELQVDRASRTWKRISEWFGRFVDLGTQIKHRQLQEQTQELQARVDQLEREAARLRHERDRAHREAIRLRSLMRQE
jgi:uncharacterized protein YlxW (UPF0749 family)